MEELEIKQFEELDKSLLIGEVLLLREKIRIIKGKKDMYKEMWQKELNKNIDLKLGKKLNK